MRGRSFLYWALAGLLCVGVIAAIAFWLRLSIVRSVVMAMSERAGISVRSLEVVSVTGGGLKLENVALGGAGGPRVQDLQIFWSPESLAARRATRISIGDLDAALTYSGGRINVDGLALHPSDSGDPMPFDVLEIASARLSMTTPWGQAAAAGNARIVANPQGLAPARIGVAVAVFELAGGRLSLSDIVFEHGKPLEAVLKVEGVDLQALLALIDVEGLSGTGSISGGLPIHLDALGVRISDGRLTATEPGIVRYLGDALPPNIPGADDQSAQAIELARKALADFHYTGLSLGLDRAASGQGTLTAKIEGSNPSVLDNHPFVLNIRLEANFDTLAQILLDGYAMAGQLLGGRLQR